MSRLTTMYLEAWNHSYMEEDFFRLDLGRFRAATFVNWSEPFQKKTEGGTGFYHRRKTALDGIRDLRDGKLCLD